MQVDNIKTWVDRYNEDPAIQSVQHYMAEEIADLRAALAASANPSDLSKAILAIDNDLSSALFEAIKVAHFRAEHVGASLKMKQWDSVRNRLSAALALQPAAQEQALFKHTGGKLYEKLGECSAKVGDTGWWQNCVRYRSVEDGKEYVTDPDRWERSFAQLAQSADKAEGDHG